MSAPTAALPTAHLPTEVGKALELKPRTFDIVLVK
jgi:hypothetical protein